MSRTILGISAFSCCCCHVPIGVCRTARGSSAAGSSPEPLHRPGCIPQSYIFSSRYLLSAPDFQLGVWGGRTSLRWASWITQRPTGHRPPAPILNGAVGHLIPRLLQASPGALQPGCSPLTKDLGMSIRKMDSAHLIWVSLYFTSCLWVLNLLPYCTGAYIRDRLAVI